MERGKISKFEELYDVETIAQLNAPKAHFTCATFSFEIDYDYLIT